MTAPLSERLVQALDGYSVLLVKHHEAKRHIKALEAAIDEIVEALTAMLRLADMGLAESLKEPEVGGNYVAYTNAKTILAKYRRQP